MNRLKLRRLWVRGFKSLANFELFTPNDLTIMIGPNGAGKSSVLQSLAFIQSFVRGRPQTFFDERNWDINDVRTKIKERFSGLISFKILLESDYSEKLYWSFSWSTSECRTISEEIWSVTPTQFYPHINLGFSLSEETTLGSEKLPAVGPEGSLVSIFDPRSLDADTAGAILAIRRWATGINSLELLSPNAMRRSVRGKPIDIGPRGERLGSFLASLKPAQKERVVRRIARFYPLQNIETIRKRTGWIDLQVAEAFDGQWRTSADHMSDGFMRLLGLAAIPELSDATSTILIDEVEDGIEPHILPNFINMISRESKAQLILTSHSPILANNFEPSQIVFVCRKSSGRSIATSFDSLAPLMDGLKYFGAGEVWANTDMPKIVELVEAAEEARQSDLDVHFDVEKIKSFMGLVQ